MQGGSTVDASLLLLGWYGFEDPSGPRMRATFEQSAKRLEVAPGLLYRYEESRAAGEGAFGICSFWAVEYLARGGGSLDEAEEWFAKLLPYANDVGIFAEEIDPTTGEPLGNVPQAFTHVGLISAALAIEERRQARRRADVRRQNTAPDRTSRRGGAAMNWGSWLIWGFAGTVVLTTDGGKPGTGPHANEHSLPARNDLHPEPRPRQGLRRRAAPAERLDVLARLRGCLSRGRIFHLVVRRGDRLRSRSLRAGRRDADLPGMHPRMASEIQGPTVVRQLEPPGFLGRNYGIRTPLSALAAHVLFGLILGALYAPS